MFPKLINGKMRQIKIRFPMVFRTRSRTRISLIFCAAASLLLILYIVHIYGNNNLDRDVEKNYPRSQGSNFLQQKESWLRKWKSLVFLKPLVAFEATTMKSNPETSKREIAAQKSIPRNNTVIHQNLTVADFLKVDANDTDRITDKSLIGYPHEICGCGKYIPPNRGNKQKKISNINSTCSHEATLFGKRQKVRSYSLFIHEEEDLPRYVLPIEENMKAHSELFPGWITRIYSNLSTVNPIVCGLICKYDTLFWCDIRNIPEYGNLEEMHGRTWRFLALGDPTVDIFLSRDMDSTIFTRERAAVAEWEASILPFHSMRDNPGMGVVMLAGLWGVKNFMLGPSFSKFMQKTLIKAATQNPLIENWDEQILKQYIHTPLASQLFLVHDSYFCTNFSDFKTLPFPTQRFEDQTVGEHYIQNVTKWTYPVPPCPVECRPQYGKDWEFC